MRIMNERLPLMKAWGWLCGLCLWLVGCVTAPDPVVPPGGVGAGSGNGGMGIDYVRIGDRISVSFADIPMTSPTIEQRVREDGMITLPLGVQVMAAGKKAGELEAEIRAEYVPKYYNRLTVGVKLEERVIYVGGRVRRPDRYMYVGEMTVLKAINVAGGFDEFADRSDVEVTRADGTKLKVNCKKAQKNPVKYDLPIYPGDNIYVNKRWI